MATRLDRLLLLLESGSTPVIRRSAAQQLGEVQRLHPHELNNLLSKVHAYLGNNQWETRIAAGMAVEAIASNVEQWRPMGTPSSPSGECEAKIAPWKEGRLQIEQFNFSKVFVHGACLLGSYGAEYDVDDAIGLDDKEKLRKQKELMNKRLGLGVAGDFFQEELIKEEDFVLKQEPLLPQPSQSSIEDLIDEQIVSPNKSEMSARERNRAKRKAKQQAKQTTAHEMDKKNGDTSDGEPSCKKYKMSDGSSDQLSVSDSAVANDNVADNTLNMDEIKDWPFEQFCDLLMHDLFHGTWEKRHGAATGLREVVKLHGRGAGRSADTPSQLMDLANQLWLEDLAVRLVCVLALDRFGDFVSDEVVAPVRETCAQTLGVTLRHMTVESVKQVLRLLTQLLNRHEWEVRHGGLLGIKYLLAVRQDVTESLLSFVLSSIVTCLEDPSDDVRAVAANALLPVTDALIQGFPLKVGPIVDTLWKILVDLDDLTSSTTSIMALLSSVLSHPEVDSERYHETSLTQLVPHLWPFLRHNMTSVRRAALRALSMLLSKSSEQTTSWLLPILADALRHVYQRCLLESDPDLLHDVFQTWSLLLSHTPPEHLIGVAVIYFGSWMCLMMQPMIVAFDPNQLIETRHTTREPNPGRSHPAAETSGETKDYIAGAMSCSASAAEKDAMVIRARRMAARLLGLLSMDIARLGSYPLEGNPCSPLEALGNLFAFYLGSKAAMQKLCTAYTIIEWVTLEKDGCSCPDAIKLKLRECLTEVIYYDEVAYLFTRLQAECRELIANIRLQGIDLDPPFTTESVLTLENANSLCTSMFDSVRSKIKPNYTSQLEDRRSSIQTIITQATNELQILTNRVQCSVAGAIICLKDLPEKMNPVVRPLMDALKREENIELQAFAGASLARLVPLCSSRSPCPVPKIVRNLCVMLCSDPKYTPVVGKELHDNAPLDSVCCDKHNGILTLYTQRLAPEPTRGRRPAHRCPTVSVELSTDGAMKEETELSRQHPVTQRRGAVLALTAIAREVGAELPEKVGALWDAMWSPLKQLQADSVDSESRGKDESCAQELVNSLQVLQVVAPALHPNLNPQLTRSVELLAVSLHSSFTVVRHMTSRCFGVLCRLLPSEVMEYFINCILPWLSSPDSTVAQRQGCIEALALMIEQLSIDVVPFIVLLVVPVLGRMSDHDQSVRLLATNVFATLVRLLPLERTSASDNSSVVPTALLEKQKEERHFLEQLLDGCKIDNCEVPVPLNVELRKYQQEGINWLAFLARYNLHGILCDDMGLGKTLQSLCILAADLCRREQSAKPTSTGEESAMLPSIVVCPPTLTGHWLFEVEKLVGGKILRPLHYVGSPSERIRLQKTIQNYNLVLASYDVVRNDIDFFSKIKWNYCILDEGQIIKNSKTKVSKAVKQLESNHRLILSGTPIQNNVLELWSLFDFLMPGFLGTEKQFQASFGRPILQSRDAKSSTKEQEAGALAMEALHRQVLPFLLRRLKEDVLQDLPPKIIQDYYCDLSPLQIQLYEDFAKSQAGKKSVGSLTDTETAGEDADKEKEPTTADESEGRSSMKAMHIFQALQYLRKVCNHPSLVLSPQHPEFSRVLAQLKSENSSMHDLHHAPKLVALKQLLNDCGIGLCGQEAAEAPVVNQHRVLLFCQLKMMLDIVEQDLFRAHMPSVTYLRLDGSVPAGARHQIVNRFNNDPSIDVLLLTTQVGGLGLNLTGADTVIFVEHDWNPMKDLQAMDRAHRIGQKKVVNVYRLITRGTLEEKIMGLQRFKINIANTVINQDNNSLASMGTSQLLDLFTVDRSTASERQSTKTDSDDKSTALRPAKQSMCAILNSLDDLWDSKNYETEYNVTSFLSSLEKCD